MPGAASIAAAAAAAKADISELEQASVVGRRIADQSFINQLNHRYGGPTTAHAPRMAERVAAERARRHAEIDQLRRNRSVSAIDSDYRAQLSAIVGELWQSEQQRLPAAQPIYPPSAAGAPAARLRRLVANGPSRRAAREPSAQLEGREESGEESGEEGGDEGGEEGGEESGAQEEAAPRPEPDPEREGAVDAVVSRLINHERQREIRMLEEQRSVAVSPSPDPNPSPTLTPLTLTPTPTPP